MTNKQLQTIQAETLRLMGPTRQFQSLTLEYMERATALQLGAFRAYATLATEQMRSFLSFVDVTPASPRSPAADDVARPPVEPPVHDNVIDLVTERGKGE